jgi:hypothetical protein
VTRGGTPAIRLARAGLVAALAATVFGLSKVHAAWVADPAYDYTGSSRFGWSLLLLATVCTVAYAVGLPDLARDRRAALGASALAGVLSAVVVSLVQLLTGDALLPRFVVFGTALAVLPIGVGANAVARRGSRRAEERDRVLLVGAEHEAVVLRAELAGIPHRPASVVGCVGADEVAAPGSRALADLVARHRASVVVLDREAQADDRVVTHVAALHEQGVRVRPLLLFYEEWLGKMPVSELERTSLLFDIGELHRARYGRAKRVLDIGLAVVGLVPLVLVVPVVALANLATSRGPLLYRQQRVGRFGQTFTIWKLRTMVPDVDPEPASALWTAIDDPRVTPVGRLLRRTHLDELPQVLNVLRGDL